MADKFIRFNFPMARLVLLLASCTCLLGGSGAVLGRFAPVGPLNAKALARVMEAVKRAHSDAFVVYVAGKKQHEYYRTGRPEKIEAMSVTKSVVSLVVGKLVTDGVIKSIDAPVATYYPEWKQGRKKGITLRHLLNHTSGLQNDPNAGAEIYPSPDFVQLALCAELAAEPGTAFAYNNKAINLLAGVVAKATGQGLDVVARERLFAPMGITDVGWTRDSAGNAHVMSGLQILPDDLAKLGCLVLNRGQWQGRTLIQESWFAESLRPGQALDPTCGLLWWLLYAQTTRVVDDAQLTKLRRAGVDSAFIRQASALRGRYADQAAFVARQKAVFGEQGPSLTYTTLAPYGLTLARKEVSRLLGYNANGYLGQYLVIYPQQQLVAVRMVKRTDAYNDATDGLDNFFELVSSLTQ